MKSLTIMIILASVQFIIRADESTTTSAPDLSTLGNEIIVNETNFAPPPYEVCNNPFRCPGVDFRVFRPKGSLTRGFYLSPLYPLKACMMVRRILSCGENSPALNDPLCEFERNAVDFLRRFQLELCTPRGLKELQKLRKCVNERKVQIYLYGLGKSFAGSVATINDVSDELNLNMSRGELREISLQLQCSMVKELALEMYWIFTSTCGPEIKAVFEKFGQMFIEFVVSTSPYGSCPAELANLFPGIDNNIVYGRKKRSLNDFFGAMF